MASSIVTSASLTLMTTCSSTGDMEMRAVKFSLPSTKLSALMGTEMVVVLAACGKVIILETSV